MVEEEREIAETTTEFWKNKFGEEIPREELVRVLVNVGILEPVHHDFICRHFDTNHDRKIDLAEFIKLLTFLLDNTRDFERIDQDNNKVISKHELCHSLKNKLNIEVHETTAAILLENFDENHNGVLERGEFVIVSIFLLELKSLLSKYHENRQILAHHLCRLVHDPYAERKAVADLEQTLGSEPQVSMHKFIAILAPLFAANVRRRRRFYRSHSHIHVPLAPVPTSTLYVDDSFKPEKEGMLPAKLRNIELKWRRPREIDSCSALFVHGIHESDVVQGNLNDCWFVGALIILAAGASYKLKELFVETKPDSGFYKCKFYHEGEWEDVIVDDRIPCYSNAPVPYFARCFEKSEFWVPIIEKAYAKLHGSYASLEHGCICEALQDLTGEATEILDAHRIRWSELLKLYEKGGLMGCAFNSGNYKDMKTKQNELNKRKSDGILSDHAYAILELKEVEKIKFVLLRNPWGYKEWNGAWADRSPLWTSEWQARFPDHKLNENDGRFYMCFEDFVDNFNQVYVLRRDLQKKEIIRGVWEESTSMGSKQNALWIFNPRLEIGIPYPETHVIINLGQENLRRTLSKDAKYIRSEKGFDPIGMYLLDIVNCNAVQHHGILKETAFTPTRDISMEYTVDNPNTIALIPCTYEPRKNSSFIITIHSNNPITVTKSDPGVFLRREQGVWGETFVSKTQVKEVRLKYTLTCDAAGNVDILLVPSMYMEKEMELKISENGIGKVSEIMAVKGDGMSICASFTAKPYVEYIIEPIAEVPEHTRFDIYISSRHIKLFAKYAISGSPVIQHQTTSVPRNSSSTFSPTPISYSPSSPPASSCNASSCVITSNDGTFIPSPASRNIASLFTTQP
jgi:Ca2+-binding EF-hand superfamily protein